MFEHWTGSIDAVTLAPGDSLLLYTDGATEATSHRDRSFGERRLVDSLLRHRHLLLPMVIQEIMRELWGFTGGRPQDDTTLVVARGASRSGKQGVSTVRFPGTEAER
jgi:sigma-B regulation protein RsbU (phosphoserine phosphatase)